MAIGSARERGESTFGLPTVVEAETPEIAGMITPFGESGDTYIAVAVTSGPEEAVAALRWHNNDGSTALGEVLLVAGADGTPMLSEVVHAQSQVYGSSDAWTQLELPVSVASPRGPLFAVFRIPAISRSARGLGGGPGLGYADVQVANRPALVSADGIDWVPLSPRVELAVEPILVAAGASKSAVGALGGQDGPSPTAARYRTGLTGVYPNPANPSIRVRFEVAHPGKVAITVYNVRGQRVRTLVDRWVPTGEHQVQWSGLDDRSQAVSSGAYFVRFEAGAVRERTRITLVR